MCVYDLPRGSDWTYNVTKSESPSNDNDNNNIFIVVINDNDNNNIIIVVVVVGTGRLRLGDVVGPVAPAGEIARAHDIFDPR